MIRFSAIVIILLCLSGCANMQGTQQQNNPALEKFAYANCLMHYFEKMGYNTVDIRSVAGGIVETSDISIDIFQEIALAVQEYHPDLQTKHNIDTTLLRCFHLEKSDALNSLMRR